MIILVWYVYAFEILSVDHASESIAFPPPKCTLQTEKSANQFVNTESSCRRIAEQMIIFYCAMSILLCCTCFFDSVHNSARIQALTSMMIFCFKENIWDGQFYRARKMSISTSRLRWLNRNDKLWYRASPSTNFIVLSRYYIWCSQIIDN